MSSLLILGTGGHSRVVADAAHSMNRWDLVAFADDYPDAAARFGLELAGRLSELEQVGARFNSIALGVGDNASRLSLYDRCIQAGFALPIIAHASAVVSRSASVGAGSVVLAQAAINPGATLGAACIVNTGATVDHDCLLADAVHISPGAHLAGNVGVGKRTWIGIGACVRQGIRIGSDAMVGAGSVVVADVESDSTVFGVPARVRS